jgi:Domain of unknown function (DUF4345)
MEIQLPQTFEEWLVLVVPLAAFLTGIVYFIAPRLVLGAIGLQGDAGHEGAFGEGRSTFAGFPIGLAAAALLFAQPVQLTMLGTAYAISALGKTIHIALDKGRQFNVFCRLAGAIALAAIALYQAELATDWFVEIPRRPENVGQLLSLVSATIAIIIGLVCFLAPQTAMNLLHLSEREGWQGASGELRGTVAGFHLAAGTIVIIDGGLFVLLSLALAWSATAFGRLISILSDRSNNLFNWLALIIAIALAAAPMAQVLAAI